MTSDPACACFGNDAPEPPVAPGLAAIPWRLATHSRFLAAMLARLHAQPALARLSTRDPSDPAIALLDAWATSLDILAFYNERIANEGYLRPATERRSIIELARLIGYAPAPGVSASVWLAISCDTVPGSPEVVTLPQGTGVMSIPGPDEKPQIFETSTAIAARPAWQDLRAESLRYRAPQAGDATVTVAPPTGFRTGDTLLMIGDERRTDPLSGRWQLRRVRNLVDIPADPVDQAPARSEIELDAALGAAETIPLAAPRIFALRQRANIFGHNAAPWDGLPLSMRIGEFLPIAQAQPQLHSLALRIADSEDGLIADGGTDGSIAHAALNAEFLDFIGDNAINLIDFDATSQFIPGIYAGRRERWADSTFPASQSHIDLDQVYDRFVTGSWVALIAGTTTQIYKVTAVSEVNATDFNMSAKVTRLTLSGPPLTPFSPRATSVYGVSEPLAWAMQPVSTPVSGRDVTLSARVTGLIPGHSVAITGLRASDSSPFAQVLMLEQVTELAGGGDAAQLAPPAPTVSRLRFTGDLGVPLIARSVRINANVVAATHGESREDIVGNGDMSIAFQTLALPQRPLTHVSAATPTGRASTLAVRISGSWWQQIDDFAEAGPGDRVFATRTADDGSVTILFGDGINGSRTPTGQGNIVARYRTGTGMAGMVRAGQLSQPLQRPVGLAGLANPLPASGAEDPESRDTARTNAPVTVRAMERIVSLTDVADFARAFGGISKAEATLVRHGSARAVVLTIADTLGGSPAPGDALFDNLEAAIAAARSGGDFAGQRHGLPIELVAFRPQLLTLHAQLTLWPDAVAADALAAARAAVTEAFGFAARDFARPASLAEAAAVLHAVPGIRAVRFARFHRSGATVGVEAVVSAAAAGRAGTGWIGAEMLTLDTSALQLTELV